MDTTTETTVTEPNTSATALCFGQWAAADPIFTEYHDMEWGWPIHDETALFELLCLEGFQVGLSWRTVLHKRDAFREAFAGFDPELMADFTSNDVERLLADARIVRNRAKIEASIKGARILADMNAAGETLDHLIWRFKPYSHKRTTLEQRASTIPEAEALASQLHKRGFRFVGPVNTYATMQACGLVNGHSIGCPMGDALQHSTQTACGKRRVVHLQCNMCPGSVQL